jgi:hypothetical protein
MTTSFNKSPTSSVPKGLSMEELTAIASFSVSRQDYGPDGDIAAALERFIDRFLKFGGHAFERYIKEFIKLVKAENKDFGFKEGPLTPLEESEQIADLALLTYDVPLQILTAQSALKKSRDCLGAYMTLADRVATNHEERLGLIRMGIAAGERIITPEQFKEYEGRFSDFDRGIAFVKALQIYGVSLMAYGHELEAIDVFYRMLQLAGGDDPAVVRKIIMVLLILNDRNDEAEKIMQDFAYGGAWWEYGRAILDFLQHGPGDVADKSLDAAFAMNPFVPPFLLRDKEFPPNPDVLNYTDGSEEEAILYCDQAFKLWYEKHPTALEWFKERWSLRRGA